MKKRVQKDIETYMPEGLEDELKELVPEKGSGSRKSGSSRSRNKSPRPEKEKSSSSSSRNSRDRDDRELLPPAPAGPVKGLGDHVPAFLQRPI